MLLFLIPPSEGKNSGGIHKKETTHFSFPLPSELASQATEKDLKCTGTRYQEGITLNTNIQSSLVLPAIERYSGVMYKAIGHESLLSSSQTFFTTHTLILSGMYGLLHPQDLIGNYKLPVGTSGLITYWKQIGLTNALIAYAKKHNATLVDLLPGSYKKMINRNLLDEAGIKSIPVNFYKNENGNLKKLTHAVKKVKGTWLHDMCTHQIETVSGLGGMQVQDEIQIVDYLE